MIDAHHAEGAGQVDLGRILEHRSVGAHDERQVGGVQRVPFEERRRLVIVGGIEHPMRAGVASEKPLHAYQVGTHGRADQDGTPGAGLDQADAAQDERPHDPLAEFGLSDQHGPQPIGGDE